MYWNHLQGLPTAVDKRGFIARASIVGALTAASNVLKTNDSYPIVISRREMMNVAVTLPNVEW
jgi:hypothetical protein